MMFDVAIIGAGPVGLAAAIEAKRAGLSYVILEKGCVVNAVFEYPTYMTFFTTAERLEIGNHPLVTSTEKATRREALAYYRLVTAREHLNLRQYSEVVAIHPAPAGFTLSVEEKSGAMGVVGLLTSPMLVLIAIWVWLQADAETELARGGLRGPEVVDAHFEDDGARFEAPPRVVIRRVVRRGPPGW